MSSWRVNLSDGCFERIIGLLGKINKAHKNIFLEKILL
jgi:hypothetical protein